MMKTRLCTHCGTKILPGDHFCTTCGAKIRSEGQQRRDKTARRAASRSQPKRPNRKNRRRSRRQSLTPGMIAMGGGVLLLVVALLLFLEQSRPAPAANLPADAHDEQGIPYPEVARSTLAEAKARYDAGTALFIDVRTQGKYETAHIANAVSLPLADLQARYGELPQEAEIITYCT